jgi:hypothetical protein
MTILIMPTASSQSNSTFLTYQNPSYGIRIQYPFNWYTEENPSFSDDGDTVVSFSSSYEEYSYYSSILAIEVEDAQDEPLEEILNEAVDSAKSYTAIQLIESKLNAMLAGHSSYKLVYTVTKDGTSYQSLEVGTIINHKIYRIAYHTETAKYSDYLPVIQKMIDSFEIVGVIPNNFSVYQNPNFGIGIHYLSDWDFEEGEEIKENIADIITFSKNATKFSTRVAINYLPISVTLDEYLKKVIDNHDNDYTDFEAVESNTNSTLADRPAYSLTYSSKFKADEEDENDRQNETTAKSMEIGTIIGNKVYFLVFDAEATKYNDYLPVIQKMIDSFKINIFPYNINQGQSKALEGQSKIATNINFLTYYNSTYGPPQNSPSKYALTIKYPSDWIKNEHYDTNDDCLTQVVNFRPLSKDAQFIIYVKYVDPGDFESLEEELSWYIYYEYTGHLSQKHNFQITALNVNSSLSDNRAIELEYSQTVKDRRYMTLEVWMELGKDVYFIVFDAEATKYNDYLPVIQKMIDSFRIEQPKITKTKDFSHYENSDYGITKVAHFECLGVAVPQGVQSLTTPTT